MNLGQAVAINMIDMVGIGPFITIPFIIGAMNGPHCIIAWILGAVLAFCDGRCGVSWALNGRRPEAAMYFCKNCTGRKIKAGCFHFSTSGRLQYRRRLVIASGAIGFAQYLSILIPLTRAAKMCLGYLVLLLVVLLYRKITDIGKISVVMWIIVMRNNLLAHLSGLTHFDPRRLDSTYSKDAFDFTSLFFIGLGTGAINTNCLFIFRILQCLSSRCGEIKNLKKIFPNSIFISIFGISVFIC